MMLETIRKRLFTAIFLLVLLTGALVVRLVSLQFGIDVDYFARLAEAEHLIAREVFPPRGLIYDFFFLPPPPLVVMFYVIMRTYLGFFCRREKRGRR